MFKDGLKVVRFLVRNPRSFLNVTLWARKEVRRNELTGLADAAGSDKGLKKHLYTRIYSDPFDGQRDRVESLREIGLLSHDEQRTIGGESFTTVPSLTMWAEYFPSAKVYGFDDKDFSAARGPWERIMRGDQSRREDLEQVTAACDSFEVIIDDALHASYHQQVTFSCLFPLVKPGGCFVIEDLHDQPPWAEEQYPSEKTRTLLERLRATGRWESTVSTAAEKSAIESGAASAELYDGMSRGLRGAKALAVLRKR